MAAWFRVVCVEFEANDYSEKLIGKKIMFGLFKKVPNSRIEVSGHQVDIVSISRNGNILFTGEMANNFPKNHMEGQIFEISFATLSGNPYFVYYLCPDYYFAAAGPAGAAAFGGPYKTDEFRSTVSEHVAKYLVQYLRHALGTDASTDIVSFEHNRAHTNVLAYVASLNNWYAIQHNDSDGEDTTDVKVSLANSNKTRITDFIATNCSSPNAV